MSRLRALTIAAIAATGIAAPVAAGAGAGNELRSAPQMRLVDAQEAQLQFTTERPVGRTASGASKLRIQFVSSSHHVSDITSSGRHGDDYRYRAKVTSDSELRVGRKYRVRFQFRGQDAVTRLVKVHPAR